jgi:hypothetical protein
MAVCKGLCISSGEAIILVWPCGRRVSWRRDAYSICPLSSCGEIAGSFSDAHLVSYTGFGVLQDLNSCIRCRNSVEITPRSRQVSEWRNFLAIASRVSAAAQDSGVERVDSQGTWIAVQRVNHPKRSVACKNSSGVVDLDNCGDSFWFERFAMLFGSRIRPLPLV